MNPDRSQQISHLYHAALERDLSQRAGFLDEACRGDDELRQEVESLLARDPTAEGFLSAPAIELAQTPAERPGPSLVGGRIGSYRILSLLGAGGMGEVYRGHDAKLGRNVALKVLPRERADDPERRTRLLREARAAASLNHPNICTIHEVGEADGYAYIAMELVEGQPLSARLADGPLAPDDVVRYGLQVADALAHAHERGVVHRDLKSANVMVTREGRAKVLDFGLAKRLIGEELAEVTTRSQASLTQPGAILGTLPYMAPEQLRGQPADARSDVWALGIVLYEMAAGARPFEGQTGFELSSAIFHEPPPPLPSRVAAPLQAVIGRCLEKEPARRYQRASEVRAALEMVGTGADARVTPWRVSASRRPRVIAGTSLAVVLGFAAAAVWVNVSAIRQRLSGGPGEQIRSIAVLPLENLSGGPEQDYFAEGIHEALTAELSKISVLKVISRTSAMQYKGVRKPAPQIARELGVDGLIEGSVAREGDQVRITVQLIHGPSDRHLWTQSFDRELRGVLALYSDVTQAISQEIRIALTPQEKIRLASARPVNPEAYEAYLRGMFYANRFTPEGFERGFAYLREAIENDPAHPLPYANLALALNMFGHGVAPPPGVFPEAKAAALKALELDEKLADAHAALAEIRLVYEWDWPGAEQAFRRALELNPNTAAAHRWYGWYHLLMGRRDEAIAEMKRTKELDPLTPLSTAWLGWSYWVAGEDEEGITEARKSLELFPDFPLAHYVLGCIYAEKGMYQEAIAAHQKAADVSVFWSWGLGISYALGGRQDEARKIAAELEKGTPYPLGGIVKNPWGLAEIYTALGEKDKALRWLEAGLEQRQSWMPWIGQNPNFKSLQDDPRFQALRRRMNLPD